jgi:hypothetical protein
LADDRADRSGSGRYEHRTVRFELGNFVQPYPSCHACHAQHTQVRLQRSDIRIDDLHALAIGLPELPPTRLAEHELALVKACVPRLNNFAHASTLERLINLKCRHVVVASLHSASHVRIHRHPVILHQELAILDR